MWTFLRSGDVFGKSQHLCKTIIFYFFENLGTFLGQNIFSEDVLSAVLRHTDMEMKNLTCNGLF